MGVKKGLEGKEEWTDKEGMLVKKVQWKGEKWGIRTVYCRGNSKEILERVSEIVGMEGKREGWIVGGDFNARTGERGALEEEEEEQRRRSKDKKVNREGEVLLN